MYRKWITMLLIAVSMTASAQTTEKEKTEESSKNKKQKMTIVIDGDKVILNGKDIKEMSPDEMEKIGNLDMLKLSTPLHMMVPRGDNVFKTNVLKVRKPDGTPRGFLGVMSQKDEKGARITSVTKESAAEKAGLQKDDIITKVDHESIQGSDDLFEIIRKHKPEDKVTITYLRDGKEKTTNATLGKTIEADFDFNFDNSFGRNYRFSMPELGSLGRLNFGFLNKPKLGIEIQDTENNKGVKITDVTEALPAAKAGLKKDDIITEINGKAINSVDEIKSELMSLKEGDVVKTSIIRAGKAQTIEIKLPKKLKTADL